MTTIHHRIVNVDGLDVSVNISRRFWRFGSATILSSSRQEPRLWKTHASAIGDVIVDCLSEVPA